MCKSFLCINKAKIFLSKKWGLKKETNWKFALDLNTKEKYEKIKEATKQPRLLVLLYGQEHWGRITISFQEAH
jgi:hypothetical protein